MKYLRPLNEFHPLLVEVLNTFARKAKSGYLQCTSHTISKGYRDFSNADTEMHEDKYWGAVIHDTRFPTMPSVGKVFLNLTPTSELRFEVRSRLIRNEKYNKQHDSYRSKETKELSKAIKLMTDFVKPYDMPEVAKANVGAVDQMLRSWRSEYAYILNQALNRIPTSVFCAELSRLQDMGVTFGTGKIAEDIADAVAKHKESVRRENTKVCTYHCFIFEDGRVSVTNMDNKQVTEYNAREELPENLQGQLALLNMLAVSAEIPEVGIKVSANEFYLLELASTSNS